MRNVFTFLIISNIILVLELDKLNNEFSIGNAASAFFESDLNFADCKSYFADSRMNRGCPTPTPPFGYGAVYFNSFPVTRISLF